jgi:inner membrane protein
MVLLNLFATYGPWAWFVIGLVLLALELVVPGGVFIWLGIAGIVTGLAAFFQPIGWPLQLVIFGLLSLVTVIGWKGYMRGREQETDQPFLNQRASRYIGHEGIINEPIRDGSGRIVLDDTIWRITGPDLAAGQKVRVVATDGPVLKVVAV